MNRVSVIIPTYNRADRVVAALESVLAQTRPPDEVIIVDDGSTDSTSERLEPLRKHIHYVFQKNRGPASARNAGIQQASGELVAFLDSDDLWLPKKLERQLSAFANDRRLHICHTNEIWIRNGVRVNPMKKHQKYGGHIFDKVLPLCIVSPSSVMMTRQLLNEVGGFDESLPACEDYDLWLRVLWRYPIAYIEESLVIKHGGHADQRSRIIKGLDQYRIRALEKLLASGVLAPEQHRLALDEFTRKCQIYGSGCVKHGKGEEGNYYLHLPMKYATKARESR
jgi:glycosyltransferase involved in cell wall biosynthesis